MYRSTLMASALAALAAISYLGTAAVANAAGYKETDLVIGGPDAKLVAGVPTLSYYNVYCSIARSKPGQCVGGYLGDQRNDWSGHANLGVR